VEVIRAGNLTLDRNRFIVTIDQKEVSLTPTEFEILATLASQPGRIFTRSQLLMAVRGVAFESYERAIDSHIRNLRRKLESAAVGNFEWIITIHGVGYKLNEKTKD
jgi:DNA-binding response OmpR family regulator